MCHSDGREEAFFSLAPSMRCQDEAEFHMRVAKTITQLLKNEVDLTIVLNLCTRTSIAKEVLQFCVNR